MDEFHYFTIFKEFSIFLRFFASILSCFDPQVALKSQNTPTSGVECYILSLYTCLSQIREVEIENLAYFPIFKEFSIFLRIFASIWSYFVP